MPSMSTEVDSYSKLTTFFSEEYRSLRAYAQSRIDNTTDRDAEDIVQDVALNIFSRADSSVPIENIAGFVYRSIRNKIVDIMRTRKISLEDEDEAERQLNQLGEELYGESDELFSEEMTSDLKKAIQELKEPYRDIIIAIDFEDYSYREIAAQTGIPEGTLMSRRHRALSLLYRALENKKNRTY